VQRDRVVVLRDQARVLGTDAVGDAAGMLVLDRRDPRVELPHARSGVVDRPVGRVELALGRLDALALVVQVLSDRDDLLLPVPHLPDGSNGEGKDDQPDEPAHAVRTLPPDLSARRVRCLRGGLCRRSRLERSEGRRPSALMRARGSGNT